MTSLFVAAAGAAADAVAAHVPSLVADGVAGRIFAQDATLWGPAAEEEAGKPVHTLVLPFAGFKASDERYQNYYRTDPNRPFCRRYIDPKLDFIRKHFSEIALAE